MERAREPLAPPEEPVELKRETRSFLEEAPGEGAKLVGDAAFLADFLWDEWSEELECAGMEYECFLSVARGYAGEIRLWVAGERPWKHCVSGLAGRVRRRSKASMSEEIPVTSEVCG